MTLTQAGVIDEAAERGAVECQMNRLTEVRAMEAEVRQQLDYIAPDAPLTAEEQTISSRPAPEVKTGIIHSISYTHDNWIVCKLKTDTEDITLVGTIGKADDGDSVTIRGYWTESHDFGTQFQILECLERIPKEGVAVEDVDLPFAELRAKEETSNALITLGSQPTLTAEMQSELQRVASLREPIPVCPIRQPLGEKVVVLPRPLEKVHAVKDAEGKPVLGPDGTPLVLSLPASSGIEIAQSATQAKASTITEGTVIAVGQGKLLPDGTYKPLTVQPGDTVFYSRYGGTEIERDGGKWLIFNESELLGVG